MKSIAFVWRVWHEYVLLPHTGAAFFPLAFISFFDLVRISFFPLVRMSSARRCHIPCTCLDPCRRTPLPPAWLSLVSIVARSSTHASCHLFLHLCLFSSVPSRPLPPAFLPSAAGPQACGVCACVLALGQAKLTACASSSFSCSKRAQEMSCGRYRREAVPTCAVWECC